MAEAFLNRIAIERDLDVRATSAGTSPAEQLDPQAHTAMCELRISIERQKPEELTQVMVDTADRIILMGCPVDTSTSGVELPGAEEWGLEDPAGQPIEKVREVRDAIKSRVRSLLTEIERENAS